MVGDNWKGTAVESTAGFEEGSKKRGTVTVERLGIVEGLGIVERLGIVEGLGIVERLGIVEGLGIVDWGIEAVENRHLAEMDRYLALAVVLELAEMFAVIEMEVVELAE